MRTAALLATALLAFRQASAATPFDSLASAFGAEGVEILASRGGLVLQGRRGERRVAAVHWKAVEALPADPDRTPNLRRLAAAAAAVQEEIRTLKLSGSSTEEPPDLPNLFEEPWGREWALRRRADRVEDPSALVKSFFEERLAGPRPDAAASRHFLAVLSAGGIPGAEARLAEDAARGSASEELRAWIRRYLIDERRRWNLSLAQVQEDALRSDPKTLQDRSEQDSLAAALASKPGLLAALEAEISALPAPSGSPRLLSAGLHLQESTRLGQHELGDEAVVSGAYWVDGLPEGASIEIEETSFIETARGFSKVASDVKKRRNGGPYVFSRRLVIGETRPFAVRAVVSAASGKILSERVEVPVAPDYELAVEKQAEALRLWLACDLKAAQAAYAELETLVAEAAGVKPQYKDLLDRARRDRAKAEADALLLTRLEDAIAASRQDADGKLCLYDTSRTDAAIKLARRLPAGCDRVLPDLFNQRSTISRRRTNQDWFLKASAEARSQRRSCDAEGAAARWSQALAVLEADPAARCGQVEEEAARAETELSETLRSLAWSRPLEEALAKAEAETVPAKKLETVRPALARLASLGDARCHRRALKKAERLAEEADLADGGPSEDELLRRLPRETSLASVIGEVKRARAKAIP